MNSYVELKPLQGDERENFIKRNQAAFMKAVVENYGPQEKEVIPAEDITSSLDAPHAEAFQILCDGRIVGGVIIQADHITKHNSLDILFVDPDCHSQGIGLTVWNLIEQMYPETETWETHTPYFETRNIHFYVNKCGFHIVEFFNPKHPDPHQADTPGGELFFRFEKKMK
ncbi:MAG: GNAT family N-acetyltransferase [Candidatus Onthomonas sp.]